MQNKTITVTISPLGKPTIEANGFQGQGCEQATAPIEQALSGGQGGVSREYKEEWQHQEEQQQEQEHQTW